ncbi:uncharacterized protein LOC131955541 [Physella acuta]|uniref:uncharacterized protein LOC131955541 n=1 Tax=Physella acuta TaxID=109671 RepID=UPI0027DC791D|nr:uncharacterized protein LOC131955541 [Physella acuta]
MMMDYLRLFWSILSAITWIFTMMQHSGGQRIPHKMENATTPSLLLSSLVPARQGRLTGPDTTQHRGDTRPKHHSKSECCENGGICVMGVFCYCPDKFQGFRCELEVKSCGPVEHGQWVKLGCNLCRCFYGKILCLDRVYGGCENKPVKEEIKIEDYQDDMTIFPNDETTPTAADGEYYDDYYRGDEDPDYNSKASTNGVNNSRLSCNSLRTFLHAPVWLVVLWISFILLDLLL